MKAKGGNQPAAGRTRNVPVRLRTRPDKGGYYRVCLDKNGKVRSFLVQRLVLETFVGPCPDGMEACHYPDSNKANNALSNLRWDTRLENVKDKIRDRPPVTEKTCRRCGLRKPAEEFYRDKRSSDGLKTECKPCHVTIARATRDPEKKRIANREYMRRLRA
jgi:hypothetical protein